jgi:hypothetical protein
MLPEKEQLLGPRGPLVRETVCLPVYVVPTVRQARALAARNASASTKPKYPPLWWVSGGLVLIATYLHHSAATRTASVVLAVTSDLIFVGLIIVSGLNRPARWLTAAWAFAWLISAWWEFLPPRAQVWTSVPVIVAVVIGGIAWNMLVLRKRDRGRRAPMKSSTRAGHRNG